MIRYDYTHEELTSIGRARASARSGTRPVVSPSGGVLGTPSRETDAAPAFATDIDPANPVVDGPALVAARDGNGVWHLLESSRPPAVGEV